MNLDTEYPILVKCTARGFELRIAELLLIVNDSDLSHGLARLLEQKSKVFELAETLGIRQGLPAPLSPPRLFAPRRSKVNRADGPTDRAT